jgi:hypothetical protein
MLCFRRVVICSVQVCLVKRLVDSDSGLFRDLARVESLCVYVCVCVCVCVHVCEGREREREREREEVKKELYSWLAGWSRQLSACALLVAAAAVVDWTDSDAVTVSRPMEVHV